MEKTLKALFRFLWKHRREIAVIAEPLLRAILKKLKDKRDKRKQNEN